MAATYPLEIVEGDRWAKQNKNLKGDALTKALEQQTWDPSVKSLVNFPQVLSMMSEKLDWTQKLGDAFLTGQKSVMDSIQRLRAKAHAAGNLKTTKEQTVIVEQTVIKIEPANPQVIYVPTYNPTVVYGAWPYPAYPPYYYYPPGYVATASAMSFAAGAAMGAAWGYAWGSTNWNGGSVNINNSQNVNINNNINRSAYANTAGTYQHNPANRQGVPYSNQSLQQRYNQATPSQQSQARQAYRGHTGELTPQGQQQVQQAQQQQQGQQAQQQQRAQQGQQAGQRSGGEQGRGSEGISQRGGGGGGGAFGGMEHGSSASSFSQRGSASRGSSGGGASRGGGGGGGRRR
jgi:uncharacterized membrane protein YgcG